MTSSGEVCDKEKEVFDLIANNQTENLKYALSQHTGSVDFLDENRMTPLQHACFKGNSEIVQLLLDLGADVNSGKHSDDYTSLHFAAVSGKSDICLMLLFAGANPNAITQMNRTPSQMAAFVGHHKVVATINHFINKNEIEYYTKINGLQTEPYLPVFLLDPFHKFVIQSSVHPVRIALNLQRFGRFSDHLKHVKKVLELMSDREMNKRTQINEIMAFKYHYLGWIVGEIIKCREHFQSRKDKEDNDSKSDYVELFAKRVLKEGKTGQLDYLEGMIRECVREFQHRECMIFKQLVSQLTNRHGDVGPALDIVRNAWHGTIAFMDQSFCSSCGEVGPDKKCSKCKEVQYCDRECQRLHWFTHKKMCARLQSTNPGHSIKKDVNPMEHQMLKLNQIADLKIN